MEGRRINKFLSEAGVCSRREADRAVAAGEVTIRGQKALIGQKVFSGDVVCYRGKPVRAAEKPVLIAFYKPRGIVCTSDRSEPENIIDYIGYPQRIYTIGRLDKDSEGLILLTNQGDLVNKIMRAGNFHEKEYVVTVGRSITQEFLDGMQNGVRLPELDVTTRPCTVIKVSDKTFRIILTQGYNRQIRRMCEVFGYQVKRLIRIRVMNIRLDGLKKGAWRDVTKEEWEELRRLTASSYSAPKGSGA